MLGVGLVLAATAVAAAAPRKKLKHEQRAAVEEEEIDDEEASEPGPRTAADDEVEADEPVEIRETVKVKKVKREVYFRAGIAHVNARTRSSGMKLEPVGIASLMPMEPPQGGIVTDPANVVTAIIGFSPATFRGYLSFETLIGIPKASKLRATGDLATKSLAPTALDLIPTGVPPLGEEIGEANAAPLMFTVVARTPELGRVRLYAGAGPVVLLVRAKVTNAVLTEVATPKIEITPAYGVVAQAGVDLRLTRSIYARLDLKEIWLTPSETRISNIHVKTTIPLLDTVEVGSATSQVQANPLIVQLGVGANF